MLKKIMCFAVVFTFMFSFMGISISAGTDASYHKNNVKCVGVKSVEYTELDKNARNQLDEVLEQNGVAQEDVLGIYRYNQAGSTERITIPGWIVLTGKWLSASQWQLVVTNARIGTVNAYVTTVQLINKSYGPVTREVIHTYSGLLPGASSKATYFAAVKTADVANYNVKGTVNHGQPFEMSGADVR